MEPYIGEIRMFAGNFAPVGWMFCQGQLVSIAEYDTLFSLIGTTYGGDGINTFGLPNLAGRVPIHQGAMPGGSTYVIGQMGGTETVTLLSQQIPPHQHIIGAELSIPTRGDAAGNFSSPDNHAIATAPLKKFFSKTAGGGVMAPLTSTHTTSLSGGNQAHENMQPFLTIGFIISMYGIYPTQS